MNFEIIQGQTGLRFVLRGPWHPRMQDSFRLAGCTEFELNSGKGWLEDHVAFLAGFPDLRGLVILTPFLKECSVIADLAQLEFLELDSNCKGTLDFSKFIHLSDCGFNWKKGGESIFSCTGLKRLFINRLPAHDLTQMSGLHEIDDLILLSPALQNLNGAPGLGNLRSVRIGAASKLNDISGISSCKTIEIAEFSQCRKVGDFSPLGKLPRLKRIEIIDCSKIERLQWISELGDLEELFFYGDTNLIDGDLSPLKKLPKLRKVVFQDRKHYSHRRENFE